MTINTSFRSFRWIGLVGFTVVLQIVIMLVIGFIVARPNGFADLPILWLAALFCVPAAWAALSLWRFRSTGERRAGYFAVAASLYWLWGAVEMLRG